jgi:hypothetical protein
VYAEFPCVPKGESYRNALLATRAAMDSAREECNKGEVKLDKTRGKPNAIQAGFTHGGGTPVSFPPCCGVGASDSKPVPTSGSMQQCC